VAFDGYHERYDEAGEPPNPTVVFYNGVQYEDSPLAVVQFWLYSAFDQFTANFHWHDWEVLHVFVDLDTGDPQLYVASSHSRSVPNNEFLDPNPDAIPRPLSELGSHSSTLSVNEIPGQFQRVGEEGLLADITNTTIDTVEDLLGIPSRTGSPRRGDAAPVRRSPSTRANRFTNTRTSRRSPKTRWSTARSRFGRSTHWDRPDRPSVPRDGNRLPARDADRRRRPPTATTGPPTRSIGYDGRPDAVRARDGGDFAFTGPQLSYEFAVPEIVEDAVASHITTTGIPWKQPRYQNPARHHRREPPC